MFSRAASGDLLAIRALTRAGFAAAHDDVAHWGTGMAESLTMARLAYAHPDRDTGDLGMLIEQLAAFSAGVRSYGRDDLGDEADGELLALADLAADALPSPGREASPDEWETLREQAVQIVEVGSAELSPAAHRAAKIYRKLWGELTR